MLSRLRSRPTAAAGVLCLLALSAYGCSSTGSGAESTSAEDAYWSSCPDVPVFDRNLDFVAASEGSPTPEAAVQSVAGPGVDVVKVITTSPGGRNVEVRSDGESGTFVLRRRDAGWLVKRGEGCAAWPAGRVLVGDEDEDEDESPTDMARNVVTRADIEEIHELFNRWIDELGAKNYEAMCAAQTAAFNADLIDQVRGDSEDGVACEAAVSAVTTGSDLHASPLTEVQAFATQPSELAQARQGSRTWVFAREGGAWKIGYFDHASEDQG